MTNDNDHEPFLECFHQKNRQLSRRLWRLRRRYPVKGNERTEAIDLHNTPKLSFDKVLIYDTYLLPLLICKQHTFRIINPRPTNLSANGILANHHRHLLITGPVPVLFKRLLINKLPERTHCLCHYLGTRNVTWPIRPSRSSPVLSCLPNYLHLSICHTHTDTDTHTRVWQRSWLSMHSWKHHQPTKRKKQSNLPIPFLSNALCATPRDYEFWASVSVALGHLWFMKETNINFVESEIVWALEWIRTDWSDQRLAATLTLTLKALALYAPTAFHSKTNVSTGSNEFLDHIGPVLSNIQPIVRVCATDALSQCFTMLHNVSKSSSIEIRQEWQHSDAKCTFV